MADISLVGSLAKCHKHAGAFLVRQLPSALIDPTVLLCAGLLLGLNGILASQLAEKALARWHQDGAAFPELENGNAEARSGPGSKGMFFWPRSMIHHALLALIANDNSQGPRSGTFGTS